MAERIYLSGPSGVVVCFDRSADGQRRGRFYHAFQREPVEFSGLELIYKMEAFFDQIGHPFAGTNERGFHTTKRMQQPPVYPKEKMVRVMKNEELLERHGDLATFVVQVKHRQNSTWQGRVQWMERGESVNFRSALELLKVIDGALDEIGTTQDDETCE